MRKRDVSSQIRPNFLSFIQYGKLISPWRFSFVNFPSLNIDNEIIRRFALE